MNQNQQQGKQTEPERIGYQMLRDLGINFIPQHLIANKFCVDAFVPEHGVVVQFDGDYWHGNGAKFPVLDARQQRRVKLDQSQDAYMRKLGYRVVRIWESTLKKDLEAARQQILSAL